MHLSIDKKYWSFMGGMSGDQLKAEEIVIGGKYFAIETPVKIYGDVCFTKGFSVVSERKKSGEVEYKKINYEVEQLINNFYSIGIDSDCGSLVFKKSYFRVKSQVDTGRVVEIYKVAMKSMEEHSLADYRVSEVEVKYLNVKKMFGYSISFIDDEGNKIIDIEVSVGANGLLEATNPLGSP